MSVATEAAPAQVMNFAFEQCLVSIINRGEIITTRVVALAVINIPAVVLPATTGSYEYFMLAALPRIKCRVKVSVKCCAPVVCVCYQLLNISLVRAVSSREFIIRRSKVRNEAVKIISIKQVPHSTL